MNKIHIIFIIFFASVFKTNAQMTIGLDAGVTSNKLIFNPNNNNLTLTSREGYIINFNIDRKLNKWLIIEASTGILQKNYSVKNKHSTYQDISNVYVHFPVGVKFGVNLNNRLTITNSIGMYYAYWTKSKLNGTAPNVFDLSSSSEGDELIKVQNIKVNSNFTDQDMRSEFGWFTKIGLNYKMAKNLSFSLKGHFYRSITDQQKQVTELQIPKFNETSALTIGLLYKLARG